jgi:hypothetical protein
MVRTLGDLNNPARDPNNPAGNPLAMGRMGRDFDWKTIPSGFYILLIAMSSIFLLTMITGLGFLLINIPVYTVLKLQVWRVFFSYLVIMDIISLLITFLVLFSLSMTEEATAGTGRYMLQILYKNLAIQLGVTVVGLLFYALFGMKVFSMGIWPVYFVYLTSRCLENPEGVTYFCMMPCPIKNKYYPLMLLGIFTVFSMAQGFPIDIWLGFALAHLQRRFIVVAQWLEPSERWCVKAQDFLSRFDGKLGKIAPLTAPEQREGPFGNQAPAANNSAPGRPTPEIVRGAFSGSGTTIGGTTNNAIFTNYDHLDKQPKPQPSPDTSLATSSVDPPASKKKNHDDSL